MRRFHLLSVLVGGLLGLVSGCRPAGEPVTVGKLLLKLDGPAAETRRVQLALEAFAPREGQRLVWVAPDRLRDYPMPPADLPLIPILRDWL